MDSKPPEMTPKALDPYSLAGQKVGALLVIKRIASRPDQKDVPEVGDFVKVVKQEMHTCVVTSLRTGTSCVIPWSSFFPLKMGERCCCAEGRCRCENLGPEDQLVYRECGVGADPSTLHGQIPGAVLVFKHREGPPEHPQFTKTCEFEIGDHLELLGPVTPAGAEMIEVTNLRTGSTGTIPWASVFPVGEREVCACFAAKRKCRCIYDDFDKSAESSVALSDSEINSFQSQILSLSQGS